MARIRLPRSGWLARMLGHLPTVILLLHLLIPNARAQFTRFQNYTDDQGLGNLSVTALAQDRNGYVLLGTQGGLYRFDGTSITPYDTAVGLPSSTWVSQLVDDEAGRIWVVTSSGIFVRLGAVFHRVDVGRTYYDPAQSHRLAASGGRAFLVADGRLLAARVSDGAIEPFRPAFGSATPVAPDLAQTRFVVSDPRGGVLLGCGQAICRLAGDRLVRLDSDLPADEWQAALRTPDGTLWARSLDHLAWMQPGHRSFAVVDVPGQRSSYFAGHAAELVLASDQHGGVLTQGEKGLLDWTGKAWHALPQHEGGLPPSVVISLMYDREGSLWAGSSGYGAFRSQGLREWENWTTQDGLPDDNVWALQPSPSGRLWIATQSGTASLPTSRSTIPASDYALARSMQGRLWAAPMGGNLVRLDPSTGTTERFASVGTVLSAAVDRADKLWLCTRTALFAIDNADAPAAEVHARFVTSRGPMSVNVDRSGTVWLMSQDGVFRENASGSFDLVVPASALKDQPIEASTTATGELWVGTERSGVLRFRLYGIGPKAIDDVRLPPLRTPEISSDAILSLFRDHRGWMWIGSDHGIDVREELGWRHFDSSDGIISNDLDEWSVAEGGDGSMWFGTSHGLSHLIDPASLPRTATLHPRVTGVTWGDRMLDPLLPVDVAWKAAPLVIHFADLDFSLGRIGFRYRMLGLDQAWSEATDREARYAHLPAGKLRFELVAFNIEHHLVSQPIGFTLRINAPWWQRWWFYTLCGVSSAFIVLALWQVRVRLLLQQKRRLTALVSARTAEIEAARKELEAKALEKQERLAGEQRRLEEMVRLRTLEIELARHELERLAMSDALTGLANRRAIMERLEAAMVEAEASGTTLAVLLCDVDRFKAINDAFGHLAGDMVLREFGTRLSNAIDPVDVAGRYGGEEFLLILPGSPEGVRSRVDALRYSLSGAPFVFGEAERVITMSGGLAFRRDGDTAMSLVGRADEALYRAKRGGRDQVEEEQSAIPADPSPLDILPPSRPRRRPSLGRSADLEHELRVALADAQFELHYQPIIDVRDNRVTSCEALLRWNSPVLGPVSPAVFIPHAEQIGLMPALGDWVLRAASREAACWPDDVGVSVNLSPLQLRRPDLRQRVASALAESGLAARRLELEVTETAMIDDVAGATSVLMALKDLGVTIALDDFGTGASSLSFLLTLPYDRLKIDKSFVHDLGVKPEAILIVRALAALCGSLDRGITGEGAETDMQIAMLREAGCAEVQGFGICRPAPPAELKTWLAGFGKRRRRVLTADAVPALTV